MEKDVTSASVCELGKKKKIYNYMQRFLRRFL